MAMTLAFTRCLSAVTKPWSEVICSFHQPVRPENWAQMNISFTGCRAGPREAGGEVAGVGREEVGEVGVLEVADPVGDAEMAQVHDGHDLRRRRSAKVRSANSQS
jgi:hypothetical protein